MPGMHFSLKRIGRGFLLLSAVLGLLVSATQPARAQPQTVLYTFCSQPNCADGVYPQSSLIVDSAGNLYGTTVGGGLGYGVVFELSPNGGGAWNESVLYSFCSAPNCADGANPTLSPVMLDEAGNLYGTTSGGGAYNMGTVFELSPLGGGWIETILYNFTGEADGAYPETSLIMDPAGNLYGTTGDCGSPGNVFELSPSGGNWTLQAIYQGAVCPNVTMDASGNIYGATSSTVFQLSPNGNGGWNPTVLYTFPGYPKDGSNPVTGPVLDKAGNLYGQTSSGGNLNGGTVYKLSLITAGKKKGQWDDRITENLAPAGIGPISGVLLDAAGNVYGTAPEGPGGSRSGAWNCGDVFALAPIVGKHDYTKKILWTFHCWDAMWPLATPVQDSTGMLYGTTWKGPGEWNTGPGVVFEVSPSIVATSITLTSSLNPSQYGEPVTFTAVVTPAPPDGESVSFYRSWPTWIGAGTLSGGSASFTTSTLPVGSKRIQAGYGGDAYFQPSRSNLVKQKVEKAGK